MRSHATFVSDTPIEAGTEDPLGFATRAKSIALFLRNENTEPPLSLSVNGAWGTGKSSLLNLIQEELRAHDYPTVRFNAWHHQSEEDLLAALLQRIGGAVPPWWHVRGLVFHGRLLAIRLARRHRVLSLLAATIAFISGFLAANLQSSLVATFTAQVPSLEDISQSTQSLWFWLVGAAPVLALGIALAELLSKGRMLSGRIGRRELDRKRDFRANIAEDLRDIARAFKPRTLTILVDDLDRCQPKVVVQLLEAIEFLIMSFDCFIIVGMARDYVERSVSWEMWNRKEFLLDDHAEREHIGDEQAQKMREFAAQYLNKLITIQIPLAPAPSEQTVSRLTGFSRPAEKIEQGRGRDTLQTIWRKLREHASGLKLTLVLLLMLSAGVYLSDQIPLSPAETPAFSFGEVGVSWLVAAWFITLGVGVALACIYAIAPLFEPGHVIEDSVSFDCALRIWAPVIFQFGHSPRAVKQFITDVRFWAMQMGGSGEMSDATLVALSSLRRLDDKILSQGDIDEGLSDYMNCDEGARLREVLSGAIQGHRNQFDDWPPLADQVAQFRKVLGEIRQR